MKRSFDWIAKPYSRLERFLFGGTFQAIRLALLPELDGAKKILVLGEGDGRFVAALLARNLEARAVVVDGSMQMLLEAQRRCAPHAGRAEFVCANVVDWLASNPSSRCFDAVVTTFFLDCLTESEVSRVFAGVGAYSCSGSRWLWADLVVPNRGLRRHLSKLLLGWLYAVFALTTNITARRLVDPLPHFGAAGWNAQSQRRGLGGILEARVFIRS